MAAKTLSGPALGAVGLIAAIVGLLILWGLAYSFYDLKRAQRGWVPVQARIIESAVAEKMRNRDRMYYAKVRYSYFFNGRSYQADSISNITSYYIARSTAQEQVDSYPAGSGVIAFVDPAKPENAVLQPSHSWITIAALFLGGLIWGSIWLFAAYRGFFPAGIRRRLGC